MLSAELELKNKLKKDLLIALNHVVKVLSEKDLESLPIEKLDAYQKESLRLE